MGQSNGDAAAKIAEFESKTGISITNDIAGSLGSEITVAIDGPVLPVPSWKLVAEVYNPDRLQFSIGKMVEALNTVSAAGVGTTTMTTEQVSGRTYYTLKNDKSPVEAHYTYVDTYLLAGSSTALLEQAINNRQTGYTLTRSQMFRSLLPRDGYTSFSGVMFFNAASTLGPILDQLKQAATPEQRKSIEAYTANSTPTLIYAYGEPDRITLASTGSFFGMNIGTLLGAHGDRGMLFPQLLGPAFGRGKMHATHTQ